MTTIEGQARLLVSPAATLAATNTALHPRMRRSSAAPPLFTTAAYGVLDPTRREIRLANAGQTPPILWPAGGEPRYLRLKGVPLGTLPGTTYEETVIRLEPGDRLLFCSDGFIEEWVAAGDVVGYHGFLQRLASLAAYSGPEFIEALLAPESPAAGDPRERDDRTAVLITALG